MPLRGMHHRALLAALTAVGFLAAIPAAAFADEVRHRLTFPEAHLQHVHVRAEFPADGPVTRLFLPTWTPGSYEINNYDADLQQFQAFAPDGRALAVSKQARDAWRVDSAGVERVTVTYRVHADDLDVSRSWVSPQWILLNGPTVFLYSEASRDLPQTLAVEPPAGLQQVLTPLAEADAAIGWRADDYDELVDSPVLVTNAQPLRFKVDGQSYFLVNVGDAGLWDQDRAAADLGAMVEVVHRLWDAPLPFERPYWFLNVLSEGTGGLEHDHGTVLMASRWQARNRSDYVDWLSLAAHEYLHAWNVRRMRPAALARYDYRREQHTSSLWIAEGVTSYYDDLALARAALVTPSEYLERLAINFHRLELTPGRLERSLEASSFDAWTRHYQPDANAINANLSYYVKGAVVAFVLDARLRRETRGRRSLDDVLRDMYSRWGSEPYPEDAFLASVQRVGDEDLVAWLEPLLRQPVEPDLDEALDVFGLRLVRHPERDALEVLGEPPVAGFGINWSDQHAGLVVGAVVHGYAAAAAGVLPGDELIAIDEERITRDTLEDRKRRLRPGERVEFLLARQGRILRLPLTLGEARPARYEIRAQERVSPRHLRRLESWLGQRLKGN